MFQITKFKFECIFFRDPITNSNNTAVMELMPETKAKSLQGIIAYHTYLFCNNDNTCYDPTQWGVTMFKKWRRVSCLAYIAS